MTASALLSTASTTKKYWVDLDTYNKWWLTGNAPRKHADILEVPSLRTLIQNILTNITSTTTLEFIPTSPPSSNSPDRLSFILHSPLNLSVTDNLGNTVSSAISTIPDGSFKRYGEVQVLKIPKGTSITLNLVGYASGSFTLDMEEIDGMNNIIASTTFSGVPSATSTTATISFPDGILQTATPLFVDYDNDGTIDFTLMPNVGNDVAFDTTSPEARISFSTTTQQLLIEGIDNGGEATVFNTATSSIITDLTGNTLGIVFSKSKQEAKEIKVQLQELYYNGISISAIPKITLQYEWSTDKMGNIKELEQKVTVGNLKVEAHYDAKKNTTKIERKVNSGDEDEKENKETFLGLRILKLVSDKGSMRVDY